VSKLIDSFGRMADDLRISVIDKCHFRCIYCMPAEGLNWLPKREILTREEILRVARILIDLGVRTIRLTGGEPLLRPDLVEIARGLTAIKPDLDLSMTTNGHYLAKHARPLAEAGLKRVNVSLDTLQPDRFEKMVRRTAAILPEIHAGLKAAGEAGLAPVKLNCVVMRGYNEDEIPAFGRLARDQGHQVRFIEFMPLDGDGGWRRDLVVPAREILERLSTLGPLVPVKEKTAEPATRFRYADGIGEVGVIASVTEPFCGSCNRVRLTADGQFRTCLFALEEHDVKGKLRAGASDEEIAEFLLKAVWGKWAGHRINEPDFVRPARSMSAIGG